MDDMQMENNNSRSTFLKRLAVGFISVFGLGVAGISIKKSPLAIEDNFNTMSVKDANIHIKNLQSSKSKQLRPEPPPNITTYIG